VYIQNDSGSTTQRQLIIDNGHTTASSNIIEVRQLFITDTRNYRYYVTSYTSPEGISLRTSGPPHCLRVKWDGCLAGNGQLSYVFSGTNHFYYSTSSKPELIYTFPYPITMDHLRIFPQCSSGYWTNYRVRAYLGSNKVFEQGLWTETELCIQGQYGKVEIQKEVNKVGEMNVFHWQSSNLGMASLFRHYDYIAICN
jgi:hypothetical protein